MLVKQVPEALRMIQPSKHSKHETNKPCGITHLIGGIPTPLKNMSSSDWIIIPTIGENKSHVPNHQPDQNLQGIFQLRLMTRNSSVAMSLVSGSASPLFISNGFWRWGCT